MKLTLCIETHDRKLGLWIVGDGNTLKSGTIVEIPGGTSIEYEGVRVRKGLGGPEILQFIVDTSINIEWALLANWLYEKVKNKNVVGLTINRRIVTEISASGIRQAIEEEIRSSE